MPSLLSKRIRYTAGFLRRDLIHTNLQLLYKCNFRCKICDFWKDSRDEKMLSTAEVEEISRRLYGIGPQIVSIGGGEPLLHPDIAGVVRALSRHHFPVMITNGWFVTEKIARDIFEAGIDEVSVSVDYAAAGRHDAQRGVPGAFDRALAALDILNKSRVHKLQRVHMISVIMEDNLGEVEPLLKICRKMGITYLVTLYSDGRGEKESRDIAPDVSAHLLGLKRRYPGFVALSGYLARFSEAVEKGGIGPCMAGKNLMNIDNRGRVSLCIDTVNDPVADIFADSAADIRRKLDQHRAENRCRSCWTSCRGSLESFLYGRDLAANLADYWAMVRPLPLVQKRAVAFSGNG